MAAPTPMAESTANWHWKNKNVSPWAKQWFERELVTVSSGQVSISKVVEVDGDCELGQRKSKLITIYDCRIELEWKGTASDGTEVAGKLSIPEVSHEITCDQLGDYVYQWTLTTGSSPAVNALYASAKSSLPKLLEAKFAEFPAALVDTHGKDLKVAGTPKGATPTAATPTATTGAVPSPAQVKKKLEKAVNTKSVSVEANFMASADDLFSLLTDEKRIPAWTRAPAQSKPEVGAEISLFGGGVRGKYVSLKAPTEIVQTWALQSPTWPSEHFATLTTTLAQSTDSTKVVFKLDGVPTGSENEIQRNLEGYYIHGLKSIGYVQIDHTSSRITSSPSTVHSKETLPPTNYATALVIGALVVAAAFSVPYLSR